MTEFDQPVYDVIIVGGGPAGLSAALLLSRSCKRIVLIDAGHPRNEAAIQVHGFLTRDGISPQELRAFAVNDLAKYECEIIHDVVTRAEVLPRSHQFPFSTGFLIETGKRRYVHGRKLLFCTGMSDELPDFDGVRACYGATIHHCPYCDGWEHREQPLLAYSSEAKKAAGLGLALRGWSKNVTVLSNGDEFECGDRDNLQRNGIQFLDERILKFVHDSNQLRGVELQDRGFLPASAMFFSSKQRSNCDIVLSLGGARKHEFSGRTNFKQATDVPGVFLAGDADGDVQFAIVAAAEGATAAVTINRELQDEGQVPHFAVSSHAI